MYVYSNRLKAIDSMANFDVYVLCTFSPTSMWVMFLFFLIFSFHGQQNKTYTEHTTILFMTNCQHHHDKPVNQADASHIIVLSSFPFIFFSKISCLESKQNVHTCLLLPCLTSWNSFLTSSSLIAA
jgi:hypothetical protein